MVFWVLTASDDLTAKVWNASSGECMQTFQGHEGQVCSAVFSMDDTSVLTASCDNTAKLWSVSTGECIQTFGDNDQSFSRS